MCYTGTCKYERNAGDNTTICKLPLGKVCPMDNDEIMEEEEDNDTELGD